MLKTEKIEFSGSGITASLIIHEATVRHSIRRGTMAIRAQSDNPDVASANMENFTFMACMAVASGTITYDDPPHHLRSDEYVEGPLVVDVGALTSHDFLELPGSLGDEWIQKTYRLNPDWRLGAKRRKENLGEANSGSEKKTNS
jgi:hypothetical protein